MKRRSLVRAVCAAVLALVALVPPAVLLAIDPDDQGLLSSLDAEFFPVLISNCAPLPAVVPCAGDQFYPNVDGNLATYITGSSNGLDYRVAYYDFFSGVTNLIPTPSPGFDWSEDYLPSLSGDKIAFWRQESGFGSISEAILVYDTEAGTTTEIKRLGPAPGYTGQLFFPAIGGNTVAFADMTTYPGELQVADLANPGAGLVQLTHNDADADKRFDEWPSVSPSGDAVVWESCEPFTPGNCDIWKATLSGGTWTPAALTTDEYVENYPSTDGVLIAYTKRPAGGAFDVFDQQDICWQPVAGGAEECLALPGYQTWPSVRGGLIAFSGVPPDDGQPDLYVYHLATNRLFRITSTQGIDDHLVDLTALGGGRFRLGWSSGELGSRDVYGLTFTLPDIDAPVIECDAADGLWHADNVSVACAAADAGKGLANTQDANFVLTTNVPASGELANAFTTSHEVCDAALPDPNCATAGPIGGNKVDLKAPWVGVTTPAAGATYAQGQVVTANYSCQDGGSGVKSCSGPVASGQPIDTSTLGAKAFQVTGTDNVLHSTVVNVPYTVAAASTFTFGGFLPPVDPLPTLNAMKAGGAVPVKFSLGGNRGLNIFAAGYPQSQNISCMTTAPQDDIEQTVSAGGSSLQYDAATDVYTYIWKTDKAWVGTCRQLVMRFTDGSTQAANFRFK